MIGCYCVRQLMQQSMNTEDSNHTAQFLALVTIRLFTEPCSGVHANDILGGDTELNNTDKLLQNKYWC